MKKRYLINEVAQRLGISTAAIRLYEKKGLFTSKKDPENGYRYYDENDIYKIWSVAYHRSYDLSISEIRELKKGTTLEEINAFLARCRAEAEETIAIQQRRITMLDFYGTYVEIAAEEERSASVKTIESLHFFDQRDMYTRSGPAFPACSFCYIFSDNKELIDTYSLIYQKNLAMISPENRKRELFSVSPFTALDSIIKVAAALDAEAALEEALTAAKNSGYTVKAPYYVSYLLSCGALDDAAHYFEVMLPLREDD